MKKIIYVIFLVLITIQVNAQSTKQKATLYFKNGTKLSCFARISGDYIRYAEQKIKSEEIKVNHKELDHFTIWMNDKSITLYYKYEKEFDKFRLTELVVDGKIKLYRISDAYEKRLGFQSNHQMLERKTASTIYFLEERDNAENIFRIGKDFKEIAKNYFSDCSELVQKLNNEELRKKDILEIVIFFNENCN